VSALPGLALPQALLSTATQSVVEGQDTERRSSPGSTLSAGDQVRPAVDGVGVGSAEIGAEDEEVGISVPPASGEDPGDELDEVPQAATVAPASKQAKTPAIERSPASVRPG
jgi:hypothetical protein